MMMNKGKDIRPYLAPAIYMKVIHTIICIQTESHNIMYY